MRLLKAFSMEEVFKKLDEKFVNIANDTEKVHINQCVSRYLAEDVVSDMDNPPFNRSLVDGYGLKAKDINGASESMPILVDVVGEVEMGKFYEGVVNDGQSVYIPTGGIIPDGVDAVLMIEYAELMDSKTLAAYKTCPYGFGIIKQGDDYKKGEVLIKKGTKITPKHIGLLASCGKNFVEVYKKPTVSILSTGDEIVDIDEDLSLGQVRDINSYQLSALCEEIGLEVHNIQIVKDDYDKFNKCIVEFLNKSDIILISGSSSQGEKDMTEKILKNIENSDVFIHGIALKPGKPTIIAKINEKPVFGLPGHPVSCVAVFKTVCTPFILNKFFATKSKNKIIKAKVTSNYHSADGKHTILFVNLDESGTKAIPIFSKSSAITQFSNADGYIEIIDKKEGLREGEEVDVVLFD